MTTTEHPLDPHTPLFDGLVIERGFDPDATFTLPSNPTIEAMPKRMRSKTAKYTDRVIAAVLNGGDTPAWDVHTNEHEKVDA